MTESREFDDDDTAIFFRKWQNFPKTIFSISSLHRGSISPTFYKQLLNQQILLAYVKKHNVSLKGHNFQLIEFTGKVGCSFAAQTKCRKIHLMSSQKVGETDIVQAAFILLEIHYLFNVQHRTQNTKVQSINIIVIIGRALCSKLLSEILSRVSSRNEFLRVKTSSEKARKTHSDPKF